MQFNVIYKIISYWSIYLSINFYTQYIFEIIKTRYDFSFYGYYLIEQDSQDVSHTVYYTNTTKP